MSDAPASERWVRLAAVFLFLFHGVGGPLTAFLLCGVGSLALGQEPGARVDVSAWAEVLEAEPDPELVLDPEVRERMSRTGAPWRVRHRASGVELLLVPPGSFLCGAGPDDPFDRANERPQHEVVLTRAFYLGRYEMTNAELLRFRPAHDRGSFYRAPELTLNEDAMPAVDVSWQDARAFRERFDANGFRVARSLESAASER